MFVRIGLRYAWGCLWGYVRVEKRSRVIVFGFVDSFITAGLVVWFFFMLVLGNIFYYGITK